MTELLFAAGGAAVGAIATLVVALIKRREDRRKDWWTRFAWATDAVASANEDKRTMGNLVLLNLATDPIAREHDQLLIKSWLRTEATRGFDTASEGSHHDPVGTSRDAL